MEKESESNSRSLIFMRKTEEVGPQGYVSGLVAKASVLFIDLAGQRAIT